MRKKRIIIIGYATQGWYRLVYLINLACNVRNRYGDKVPKMRSSGKPFKTLKTDFLTVLKCSHDKNKYLFQNDFVSNHSNVLYEY